MTADKVGVVIFHRRHQDDFDRRLLGNDLVETRLSLIIALGVQAIEPYAGAPVHLTIQHPTPGSALQLPKRRGQ